MGWEPTETHTHYDADGNLTGYTVVEREPEWTPTRRARVKALERYDADSCSGCGLHKSILENPEENVFVFEDHYCDMCRAEAVHGRVKEAEHQEADKRLGDNPPPRAIRAKDGWHTTRRRATPDEIRRSRR